MAINAEVEKVTHDPKRILFGGVLKTYLEIAEGRRNTYPEKAFDDFDIAAEDIGETDSNRAIACFWIGEYYRNGTKPITKKDENKAKQYYQKALQFDPTNDLAKQALHRQEAARVSQEKKEAQDKADAAILEKLQTSQPLITPQKTMKDKKESAEDLFVNAEHLFAVAKQSTKNQDHHYKKAYEACKKVSLLPGSINQEIAGIAYYYMAEINKSKKLHEGHEQMNLDEMRENLEQAKHNLEATKNPILDKVLALRASYFGQSTTNKKN